MDAFTWIVSESALRFFLPVYMMVFILANGPIGGWLFERKHGFNPLVIEDPDPVMQVGEYTRNVLFLVILLVCVAYAMSPSIQGYLGPVRRLETPAARGTGIVFLVGALVLVRGSQLQLGRSWRYGIDRSRPPDRLVTAGVFAHSRNPIYLGMLAAGVGLFLTLPNVVTFLVPTVSLVIFVTRIRMEEDYLSELWGEEWERYRARTPRWLFGPKG